MTKDLLIHIFTKKLGDKRRPNQSRDELIFEVVAEYMYKLMQMGNIPQQFLDQLETDLKEEVLEIYRKKTYGALTLQEFRSRQVKNNKSH